MLVYLMGLSSFLQLRQNLSTTALRRGVHFKYLKEYMKKWQGWKVGKMGKRSQRYKLPVIKQINPMNVMYSIVAIVNNTVLHI